MKTWGRVSDELRARLATRQPPCAVETRTPTAVYTHPEDVDLDAALGAVVGPGLVGGKWVTAIERIASEIRWLRGQRSGLVTALAEIAEGNYFCDSPEVALAALTALGDTVLTDDPRRLAPTPGQE